ncbi:MAG: DUF3291 domain-containing protein [Ilumatobacteraceae bacterium]
MDLHLAQLNVATLRHAIDTPQSSGFADGLDPVNAAGEAAAGFVWRLQADDGNATSISVFPNPLTIVNLTVWESQKALRDFAYRGLHREFFRRRAEWFEPGSRAVMWWIVAGTLPTVNEAKARLEYFDKHGPSSHAFEFGQQFPEVATNLPQ